MNPLSSHIRTPEHSEQGASHSALSSTAVGSSPAVVHVHLILDDIGLPMAHNCIISSCGPCPFDSWLHWPSHDPQPHLVFRPDALLYDPFIACHSFLHPTAHLETAQFSGKAQLQCFLYTITCSDILPA